MGEDAQCEIQGASLRKVMLVHCAFPRLPGRLLFHHLTLRFGHRGFQWAALLITQLLCSPETSTGKYTGTRLFSGADLNSDQIPQNNNKNTLLIYIQDQLYEQINL